MLSTLSVVVSGMYQRFAMGRWSVHLHVLSPMEVHGRGFAGTVYAVVPEMASEVIGAVGDEFPALCDLEVQVRNSPAGATVVEVVRIAAVRGRVMSFSDGGFVFPEGMKTDGAAARPAGPKEV